MNKFILSLIILSLIHQNKLHSQTTCNRVVFKGAFNTSDTVYILVKNENMRYAIGFDSMRLSFQPIVGQANFFCVPNANRLIIVYNNKTTKVTNRSRSKEIVIKKTGSKLVIRKQRVQGYL